MVLTDGNNVQWYSFDEIEEALIQAIDTKAASLIDFLNDLIDRWIELEFEQYHGFSLPIPEGRNINSSLQMRAEVLAISSGSGTGSLTDLRVRFA